MGWTGGRQGNALRATGFAGLLVVLSSNGCSGAGATPPTVALASTHAIQVQYEKLITDWTLSSREERVAMKPRLDAFRAANPADLLSRNIDALLAWIALEQGDYVQAQRTATFVQSIAGPGTISDLARTVQGAALRRSGRPEEALKVFTPLVGKLIDNYARVLLNDEIVESALAAKRYPLALDLMARSLREAAPEERDRVRGAIGQKLPKVPPEDLLRVLNKARAEGALADEDQEMRRVVVKRIAEVVLARRDVELAKHLLATSGSLLGDQGDAVAQLAAGVTRPRVEARTVGLVVSLRDDDTRRKGAEVADGVTFGLGLPGSLARLVSRDDRGDLEHLDEALTSLSADGASILIAGVDDKEATVAARFAEQNQIPVILLTAPSEPPGRFTFLLGADRALVEDTLAAALAARGAAPVAIVSSDPKRPVKVRDVTAMRGCSEASLPWKPLGVSGVVLNASCASEAMVAAAASRVKFAAGLEAGLLGVPVGSLRATAGIFPIDGSRPPAALDEWMKRHAAPPSYWAALGRDAAALAWTCVQALPARATEDPKEVAARRAQAAQALAGAQAELWTSDARGFGGMRVMPRSIGVREVK